MYLEAMLSGDALKDLLGLEEIATWKRALLAQLRGEAGETLPARSKPSSVHTRRGDRIDLTRRHSYTQAGREEAVLGFLQGRVLPLLSTRLPGNLELYSGHYDLIAYPTGGFFGKHVDYVSSYGPGLTCWHVLLCLAAPQCSGGETLVYPLEAAEPPHCSRFSVTPGGLLAIMNGTPHEGREVLSGAKLLLKFEVFHFEEPMPPTYLADDDVLCHCHDGQVRVPLCLLLKQVFFQRLFDFEGERREIRLQGLSSEELRALVAYLEGSSDAAQTPPWAEKLPEIMDYIAAPEATLTSEELGALMSKGFVSTRLKEVARRLRSLDGLDYAFVGILHEWSLDVQGIWDWYLDLATGPQAYLSQLCMVSSGEVIFCAHLSGRRRLAAAETRGRLKLVNYSPQATLDVFEVPAVSDAPRDTLQKLEALLRSQVRGDTIAPAGSPRSRQPGVATTEAPSAASLEATCAAPPPPPLCLSLRQCKRLAELFLHSTTAEEMKQVLETHAMRYTSAHDVFDEGCNDGDSYLTTTLYQTRIFDVEWVLFRQDFLRHL